MRQIGFIDGFSHWLKGELSAFFYDIVRCTSCVALAAYGIFHEPRNVVVILFAMAIFAATFILNIEPQIKGYASRLPAIRNWRSAVVFVAMLALCFFYPSWWIVVAVPLVRILVELGWILRHDLPAMTLR